MLSPDRLGPKRVAPSIWSLDSGYQSHSLFSTSLEDLAVAQPDERLQTKSEEPSIDPIITKHSLDNGLFLPELERDGGTCLTCEFWKITNPEGVIKCEDCRIPELVGSDLLVFAHSSFTGHEPVSYLSSPKKIRERALNTSKAARCSACKFSALTDPSSPTSCQSCSPNSNHLSPISPASSDHKVRRSRAGRNLKLPLRALNKLQAWLDEHHDDPYPSGEVKRQLAQECGITEKQINTWMTNARARQLNPLDTWLSSGSEDNGAHESDIASAANTLGYAMGFSYLSENHAPGRYVGSVSGSSALSAGNPRPHASRRGKKKNYRRTNQPPQIAELSPPLMLSLGAPVRGDDQEMWQCTFCKKYLVPKSWRRHEETQHMPKAKWTCMLYGPLLSFPSHSNSHSHPLSTPSTSNCAFCMVQNPSPSHFSTHHRISECAKRPINERIFYRPDHLRQHVKNFHDATLFEIVQGRWKEASEMGEKGYTCGFCGTWLESWDRRETHIAGHFKDGATIGQWRNPEEWERENKGGDMDMGLQSETSRRKAKGQKENKDKKDEVKYISGLARLSRTFSLTRRSTRKLDTQAHQNSQPPPTLFANASDPIPVSDPLSTSTTLLYPVNNAYPTAPVLPDINMDPLMPMGGDDGYENCLEYQDWSQVCAGSAIGRVHSGTGMGMAMDVSMTPDTQFGCPAYGPEFERNIVDFGGIGEDHGDRCENSAGWGRD